MNIHLKHIKQIEAIARLGSFNKAADELYISQPALSRSISTLEKSLGGQIFNRSTRVVMLTSLGRMILERGASLLNEMKNLEHDISSIIGLKKGKITIGSGPIATETIMLDAVAKFIKLYPDVSIQLINDHPKELIRMLHKRELDFLLADIRYLPGQEGLEQILFPVEKLCYFARDGHPVFDKPDRDLFDIMKYTVAFPTPPDNYFQNSPFFQEMNVLSLEDLQMPMVLNNNLSFICELAATSDVIGIGNQAVVNRKKLPLRVIEDVPVPFDNLVGIIYLQGMYMQPAAKAMIDILKSMTDNR